MDFLQQVAALVVAWILGNGLLLLIANRYFDFKALKAQHQHNLALREHDAQITARERAAESQRDAVAIAWNALKDNLDSLSSDKLGGWQEREASLARAGNDLRRLFGADAQITTSFEAGRSALRTSSIEVSRLRLERPSLLSAEGGPPSDADRTRATFLDTFNIWVAIRPANRAFEAFELEAEPFTVPLERASTALPSNCRSRQLESERHRAPAGVILGELSQALVDGRAPPGVFPGCGVRRGVHIFSLDDRPAVRGSARGVVNWARCC
ncbi:MAG TPA: hypothetical protein VFD90_10075 [Gaiellales bacterium]|jgi:hypothetical protein|nr:hypothetical protein [Gaiellales bacterium]